MNGSENLRPAELKAQDAVRSLETPVADSAFRERLKQEFVEQSVKSRIDWPAPAAGRSLRKSPYGMALAIAAMLAFLVLSLNRGMGPTVIGGNGLGFVSVDGIEIPTGQTDAIESILQPGATLVLEGGAVLDLVYPGSMSWRVFSGTTIRMPASPGRWFGRGVNAHMEIGEVSVRTGSSFPGTTLGIATDEGLAIVTGTLVSVVRNEEVTCVCVHEGTVRMEADGKDLGNIPIGKRRVLFRDGSDPVILDIAAPHRDHLIEFDSDLQP